MQTRHHQIPVFIAALAATFALQTSTLQAFEGRISAVVTQDGKTTPLLYTVGTNFWRIEVTTAEQPNTVDILERNSGQLTLLLPRNRSFVRLNPAAENTARTPHGFPAMPMPPSGAGPQTQPSPLPAGGFESGNVPERPAMPQPPAGLRPGIGPQAGNRSGAAAMPNPPQMPAAEGIPALPMRSREQMELKATGEKTNLLGCACARYELKQRGETMEIWATDALPPFQGYVRNQPHRFGPLMIEEQWPELVKAKKLFPLRATLKFDNGSERYRFEVKSVGPDKITDEDGKLFQPPADYHEVQPLPY